MTGFISLRKQRRDARHQRGQGLVEFSVVVPIMFLLAVALGDFGRLYTTALAVEAAAREAADYGAYLGAQRWDETDAATISLNEAEMRRRACTAASELPGYVGLPNPTDTGDCSSPVVTIHPPIHPPGVTNCTDPAPLEKPCWIKVTVTHAFEPLVPIPPIPSSITLTRESIFAISDLAGE